MNSIFENNMWYGKEVYVDSEADFLHHNFDPSKKEIGDSCFITFSSNLYRKILEIVPTINENFKWPYSTTPLIVCKTKNGKTFSIHFPSYGGTRIANSLEQLKACGVKNVFGLGLGGTPQKSINIGDVILLEGAVRGDGVSRYYAPIEFPGIADLTLVKHLSARLDYNKIKYRYGISFGTDALYREEKHLIELIRDLDVALIDLESSAFLTVGRRLGLKCCWIGVVSDRLVNSKHEGNIHSEHIEEKLTQLGKCIIQTIEET